MFGGPEEYPAIATGVPKTAELSLKPPKSDAPSACVPYRMINDYSALADFLERNSLPPEWYEVAKTKTQQVFRDLYSQVKEV